MPPPLSRCPVNAAGAGDRSGERAARLRSGSREQAGAARPSAASSHAAYGEAIHWGHKLFARGFLGRLSYPRAGVAGEAAGEPPPQREAHAGSRTSRRHSHVAFVSVGRALRSLSTHALSSMDISEHFPSQRRRIQHDTHSTSTQYNHRMAVISRSHPALTPPPALNPAPPLPFNRYNH